MVDLVDFFLEGFKLVIEWITGRFMQGLRSGYKTLTGAMFGTPTPDTAGGFVFGTPTNPPWPALQEALVGGEITLIGLLLLVMAVQARHLLRMFDYKEEARQALPARNAWQGAVLIVVWYWAATLLLFLVEGFTLALLPSFESVGQAMLGFLGVALVNPVLAFLLAVVGGIAMWILDALFFIRDLLLLVYLYGGPIAIALAFGSLPVVSPIAMGFLKRFVPLAILPLPVAIVFKGVEFLFSQQAIAPSTAFLKVFVAAFLPVLALYVGWKTFTFAAPLTARVLGGTARGAVTVGAIAAGAAVAGPAVGATAARWGPRAAAGHIAGQRIASSEGRSSSSLSNDSIATDSTDRVPAYRRTENDPSS